MPEARKSLMRKTRQDWWWYGSLKMIQNGGQEVKGQGVRTPAFCEAVTLVEIYLLDEVKRRHGRPGMGQDIRAEEGRRCEEFRSVCPRGRRG